MEWLIGFFEASGIAHLAWGNLLMIVVGCVFVYLAIARGFEPLLLVPIGFGIILGNMPLSRVWGREFMIRAAS